MGTCAALRREEWADKVLEVYFRYAPNLRDRILGRHIITPLDLERVYNITGGNIFHASMIGLENNFNMRPIPEAAHYRTPIQGYYLCGSGSHPGGGVSGAPGHNAAKRILADREGRFDERVVRVDAMIRSSALMDLVMSSRIGLKIGYSVARNPVFRKFTERMNKTNRSCLARKQVTYVTDARFLPEHGECRAEAYGDHPLPAQTFLVVSRLAWPGMLVERDATAIVGSA